MRRGQVPPAARARAGPALLVLLAALAAPAALAQRYNVRSYTNSDGLPQRQVFALLQDRAGYLWFGTYGGLSRYDGSTFVTFDASSGLGASTVLDVAEDRNGRLVVGTQGGGLSIRDAGGFTVIRKGPSLISDNVQRIVPDRDGTLWVATEGGLTHLVTPAVHYTSAEGLPSDNVLTALRDRRGRLWAGTKKGLALFAEGRFRPVVPERLGHVVVRTLLEWGDDLLVGGDGALFLYRSGDLIPFPTELPAGPARDVYDAALSREGVLWLATLDGAFRWDGRVLERYGPRQGLVASGVHRVLLDREGDVWFGTEAGVSKLGPGPFVGYTEADGLCHPFVRALGEDALGRVWVGTRAGISVFDGGRFATIREGLPAERIYAFAGLPDGRMLVGTRGGLALVSEGRVARVYRAEDGLPDPYVTSLVALPDGRVVIGTAHGIAIYREGAIVPVADPLMAGAYVLAMKDDASGRIWVGLRTGGVLVWDGTSARTVPLDPRLERESVWTLERDPRGRIWVGTNGFGIFVVDGGIPTRVTTKSGLVSDFVWQVLADDAGGMWCYTSHGLDRTDGRTFTHYGIDDGLVDLEGSTNAALRQRNGDLWFGSGTGLSRFVPARVRPNGVPPPVVIEEVTASGVHLRDGARLAHDAGVLSFRVAALSFRSESSVRFRHRLLPVDPAWSEPTPSHSLEYGRLSPGRYVLEVIAQNEGGVASLSPARFAFQVRAPWWGTAAFRLAVLFAVALAGIGLGTLRSHRIEADRRRLAALVAARTSELEERNAELRRLATSDALTGVANRRYFLEMLETEIKRSSRAETGGTVALLMIDLDHFKDVNDTRGHSAGDQLLAAVAARVKAAVRSTDLVARYGGEEFAVLLPETRLAGAETIARKIHGAVGASAFDAPGGGPVTITASFGVAALEDIRSWHEGLSRELIDRSDAALYRAKALGRNRVETAA